MASNDEVAETLRHFYLRSHRAIDRVMLAEGASFARTKMLAHIAEHGPLRSTDLAAAFDYAPRTVTEAIDGLERDGFVIREPEAGDRRAKRISLTPSGSAVVAAANASRGRFLEAVFGTLSAAERGEIVRLIGKLNDRLAQLLEGDRI